MEGSISVHPFHGPLCFLFDHFNVSNGWQEIVLLIQIFDVGVNEEGVGFGVNVFHGDLKPIKAPCFRYLNLGTELLCQVLEDNPIWGGKEGENVFNEMFFILIKPLPVFDVLVEIDLISGPEGGDLFFIHFIDWVVLYGEKDEALWVFSEYGFFYFFLCEGSVHNSNINSHKMALLIYAEYICIQAWFSWYLYAFKSKSNLLNFIYGGRDDIFHLNYANYGRNELW